MRTLCWTASAGSLLALLLVAATVASGSATVIVKVCTFNASNNFNGMLCNDNCTFYAAPADGCLIDPTDPWMSMQLRCQLNARCFTANRYSDPACETPISPMTVVCGDCSQVNQPDSINTLCTVNSVMLLTNCTKPDCGSCKLMAEGREGDCVKLPGPSGTTFSGKVTSSQSCTVIEHISHRNNEPPKVGNCSATNIESNDGYSYDGECAYANFDNEGEFSYAFYCLGADRAAAAETLPQLPARLASAIHKSKKNNNNQRRRRGLA